MGVFGGETEGGGVFVVDFVDAFVEWAPVEETVEPVMPCVFEDEEDGDLEGHGGPGWEWDVGGHSGGFGEGVEKPDLGQFDDAVGEENRFDTAPLLGGVWNFLILNLPFLEVRDSITNHPRQAATKVDELMHDEGHDTGSEDIICDPSIPGSPHLLEDVEGAIDLADVVVMGPVGRPVRDEGRI